ncbi:hypothetical protein P700755_003335 [Psychroflexus torquis ATCC 700755]|uniref:Uncharacterized protein n=1 Tax=Psychroflexus torquis (strain ATCC 700755 / CIP 106069 / ACAM 623) TaxID=313595 RepID=K4ILP6_PSYTT|nr:hypothetical protein [Psychroflexus torquis]AFU69976.1 hypothetical protein P700755_003335 [Psychroflexus torquis ATCC 700755]
MNKKIKSFLRLKYSKILVDAVKDFTSNESMNFAAGTAFYTNLVFKCYIKNLNYTTT